MLVIFIAIDPVELQPFGEFGSQADFALPIMRELPQEFFQSIKHDLT
jgi:hypothetical protein